MKASTKLLVGKYIYKKTVKWKFSSKIPNLISQMMRDMFMQQAKKKRRKRI